MKRYDLVIVGAGPAGLSAAVEAAKAGMKPIVFDENARPGGQLFKQIHKFFGSKEHHAKIRGFKIGEQLLEEAKQYGVTVSLNATVEGLYSDKELTIRMQDKIQHIKGDNILIATGANENMVTFSGWTKPGVIGAGAAQTMMNLHHIRPGNKILMLGSGNVGLVVSYQLMQAGCQVVALVDAAPKVGGYGVHAAKIARCGVPFYLSHTIVRAEGEKQVTGAVIAQVDENFQFIKGTEKHFEVDAICVAVGLTPMSQILKQAGCDMADTKMGVLPKCDVYGETSVKGIYAAGDVAGIEEASSAMVGGSIAGAAIACAAGYLTKEEYEIRRNDLNHKLGSLREGMFAPKNRGKEMFETEEGFALSQTLLQKGYITEDEIEYFPGVTHQKGIHPVMECTQNIPCNPCQDACPMGCIKVGEKITNLPAVSTEKDCIGCGKCVATCPGQAIFLINETYDENSASVTIPYEFLPLPQKGDKGIALDRSGKMVCEAEIVQVKTVTEFDKTHLLTMKVPKNMSMRARFFKSQKED